MGPFGVAAILAALCSSLCLYGSSSGGGDLKFAARIKSEVTFGTRTKGSLFCALLAGQPVQHDFCSSIVCQLRNKGLLTSIQGLVLVVLLTASGIGPAIGGSSRSRSARPSISPHIRAPFPLHCLCDSERAASMGCGQQTSTDRQQGCVLRCPGGQAAAVRSRDYTDIGRTSAAAQLHYQGFRSRGNISCGITQGVLPQGQQFSPSRIYCLWGD